MSNLEIEFHIMHVHAYRKDDIFIQRRLVQSFEWKENGCRGLKPQSFVQKVQPSNNSNIDKTFPAEAYSVF